MRKALVILAMAVIAQIVHGAGHSVSLSVNQPRKTENREKDNDRSYSYSGYSSNYRRDVITKSSSWYYTGKVGCSTGKNESTTITVEAFFVTRGLEKGAKERIDGEMEVGHFEFGGGKPRMQTFEFDSPEFEETEMKRSSSSRYYGGSSSSEHSGTRYLGVILRAVEDGKILKVVSMPSNPKWIKAGKEDIVTFDEKKARKASKVGGTGKSRGTRAVDDKDEEFDRPTRAGSKVAGDEAQVFTRIPGTGASTIPGWMDDFFEAQEIAKKENKWIVVVFSGSDWCFWCKKLADSVLKTAKFQNGVKDNYLLVFIDSPHDKSLLSEKCRIQNPQVRKMLGASGGVPNVMIVTELGEKIADLGGCTHTERGADSYLAFFKSIDNGLRIVRKAKDAIRGKNRTSPEALKTLHEALMQVDEDIVIDYFRSEVDSIIRADASYRKFYPYFDIVRPLEEEMQNISKNLSKDANALLRKEGIEYTYDAFKERKRRVFEDEDYASKFNAILTKVNDAESSLKRGSPAHLRLGKLRGEIYERINSK